MLVIRLLSRRALLSEFLLNTLESAHHISEDLVLGLVVERVGVVDDLVGEVNV